MVIMLLGMSCKKIQKEVHAENTKSHAYTNSEHLIEARELLRISDHRNIKIVDFRKKEDYSKGHIPKALNIWRSDLEDKTYPYRGMAPQKEAVETLFSRLGISNQDTIIVYDNKGSSDAARLWWVLKNYDFEAVQILNGGLLAWEAIEGAIGTEAVSLKPTKFVFSSDTPFQLLANKEQVLAAISSDRHRAIIVDARTADEYSGKKIKEGAAKAGRIPKSIHIDWEEAIDNEGTKKFKPFPELKKIYDKMGASKSDPIIVYCHTGGRSSHTTFVLTQLLGYENVSNYDGSWTEWSQFDNLPFEKDSITIVNK